MATLEYTPVPFLWRPMHINGRGTPDLALSRKIEHRLEKACLRWEKTPYKSGIQMPGEGADCVRFFAALVDDLYGYRRTPPDRLPQDYSMHTRAGAIGVMKKILRLYPEMRRVRGRYLEPADVVVVGPLDGGPSHCLTVGARHNTLWHAIQGAGVCWTGWALIKNHQRIFRVYRFKDRESWGQGWRTE